jgi:hypothetical protein
MLSQLHTSYALHLVFDFFTILFPGWCTRILWSGCKFPKRILLHTSCTKGKNSRAAYDLIFLFPSIPSQFLDIFLFSHHYFFLNFISKSDLFLAKMFLLLHLLPVPLKLTVNFCFRFHIYYRSLREEESKATLVARIYFIGTTILVSK